MGAKSRRLKIDWTLVCHKREEDGRVYCLAYVPISLNNGFVAMHSCVASNTLSLDQNPDNALALKKLRLGKQVNIQHFTISTSYSISNALIWNLDLPSHVKHVLAVFDYFLARKKDLNFSKSFICCADAIE